MDQGRGRRQYPAGLGVCRPKMIWNEARGGRQRPATNLTACALDYYPRRRVRDRRSCISSVGDFQTRPGEAIVQRGIAILAVAIGSRRCHRSGANLTGAELADANGADHHSARGRRRRRHFRPAARRRTAEEIRPAVRGREPSRRRAQHRHARLRGSAARRLHALRPVERADHLQPVPVQQSSVQSREGFRADHQPVLQPGSAGGECAAQGQDHSRPDRAGEGKARHVQLRHILVLLAQFMEKLKKKHGVDIVRVPFRSGNEVVNAIMSGTTPIALLGLSNMLSQIRAATSPASRSAPMRARRCSQTCRR